MSVPCAPRGSLSELQWPQPRSPTHRFRSTKNVVKLRPMSFTPSCPVPLHVLQTSGVIRMMSQGRQVHAVWCFRSATLYPDRSSVARMLTSCPAETTVFVVFFSCSSFSPSGLGPGPGPDSDRNCSTVSYKCFLNSVPLRRSVSWFFASPADRRVAHALGTHRRH